MPDEVAAPRDWRREYEEMHQHADRVSLDSLLDSFKLYLDTPHAWSRAEMNVYRGLFATYGVYGDTADDLVDAAEKELA